MFFLTLFICSFSYGQLDTAYWNHVYNPKRLKFIKADTVMKGVVERVSKEADGDYHVKMKVKGKRKLLAVEIICFFPEKKAECQGYINKIPKPKKGNLIEVKGDYVYDRKHKWYEIHPVKSLKIIQ